MNDSTAVERQAVHEALAARYPWDILRPSFAELCAELGDSWVIAKRTKRIVERYGDSVRCYTPLRYNEAMQRIYARRGFTRPAEKVVRDLIDAVMLLDDCYRAPLMPAIAAAATLLQHPTTRGEKS